MKTFFSNEKFRGRNPNLKKKCEKTAFLRFEADFFVPMLSYKAFAKIHCFKIFCKMYGLVVMLSIPTPKLHPSI